MLNLYLHIVKELRIIRFINAVLFYEAPYKQNNAQSLL